MSQTVPVRFRTPDSAKPAPFTEWPIGDLEGLVRRLRSWGVYDQETGETDFTFSGQFVLEDGDAYFEIIAHFPKEG